MKYFRNLPLNEISKYFKPVDYIEELTPEEEETRDLQNYYNENLNRINDFVNNFDSNNDKLIVTFYKTLYQTGAKKIFKKSYADYMNQLYYTENPIKYPAYLTLTLIKSMVTDSDPNSDDTVQSDDTWHNLFNNFDCTKYIGISIEIEEHTGKTTIPFIYIQDVSKYKKLFQLTYSKSVLPLLEDHTDIGTTEDNYNNFNQTSEIDLNFIFNFTVTPVEKNKQNFTEEEEDDGYEYYPDDFEVDKYYYASFNDITSYIQVLLHAQKTHKIGKYTLSESETPKNILNYLYTVCTNNAEPRVIDFNYHVPTYTIDEYAVLSFLFHSKNKIYNLLYNAYDQQNYDTPEYDFLTGLKYMLRMKLVYDIDFTDLITAEPNNIKTVIINKINSVVSDGEATLHKSVDLLAQDFSNAVANSLNISLNMVDAQWEVKISK